MSGLPIFGISRLRHCHVGFTCSELEAGDGGMCVGACVRACVHETESERMTHHRHVSIFMCLSL